MLKIVEAFWIMDKVLYAVEGDQFLDDFFKVKIWFQTTLEGGGQYAIVRQGREFDKLLRGFTGAGFRGNLNKKLRFCRKKPVLLVINREGNCENIQAVLPR